MRIKNRGVSAAYKLLLVLAGFFGLLLIFGVFDGKFKISILNYFTILSNLLCVVYFILDLGYIYKNRRDGTKTVWCPALKGIAMMAVTVTWLVAHFVLGLRFTMSDSSGISLLFVHYLIPIMVIIDWLLFDPKGLIKAYSPLVWPLGPLLYFAYAMVAARIGNGIGDQSRYPYPFLDVDKLGWGTVLLTVLIMVAAFVVLGYIYFGIDTGLKRIIAEKPPAEKEKTEIVQE
jgi:hypothetical protein